MSTPPDPSGQARTSSDATEVLDARELAVATLRIQGVSFGRIAHELKMPRSTACDIAHRPHVAAMIARVAEARFKAVDELLTVAVPAAIERLMENLEDPDGHVANTAANIILKAKGLGGPRKVEISGELRVGALAALSDEDLAREIAVAEAEALAAADEEPA
jgi:hypothetical protein